MIEWLDEFYESDTTRNALLASMGPLFTQYAVAVWKADGGTGDPPASFVSSLVAAYVAHHLDSSRIQLTQLLTEPDPKAAIQTRVAEWVEKRPAKVALNETIRASNALAIEQMRASGVTRKVWRSSGGSCPYCKSMNGRTVEIERDFFEPGDEFSPDGAERPLTFTSSIGHPPVHQGCDCSITAE